MNSLAKSLYIQIFSRKTSCKTWSSRKYAESHATDTMAWVWWAGKNHLPCPISVAVPILLGLTTHALELRFRSSADEIENQPKMCWSSYSNRFLLFFFNMTTWISSDMGLWKLQCLLETESPKTIWMIGWVVYRYSNPFKKTEKSIPILKTGIFVDSNRSLFGDHGKNHPLGPAFVPASNGPCRPSLQLFRYIPLLALNKFDALRTEKSPYLFKEEINPRTQMGHVWHVFPCFLPYVSYVWHVSQWKFRRPFHLRSIALQNGSEAVHQENRVRIHLG